MKPVTAVPGLQTVIAVYCCYCCEWLLTAVTAGTTVWDLVIVTTVKSYDSSDRCVWTGKQEQLLTAVTALKALESFGTAVTTVTTTFGLLIVTAVHSYDSCDSSSKITQPLRTKTLVGPTLMHGPKKICATICIGVGIHGNTNNLLIYFFI